MHHLMINQDGSDTRGWGDEATAAMNRQLEERQAAYADSLKTSYHQGRSDALKQLDELAAISPGSHTFRTEIYSHRGAQVSAHETGNDLAWQYHAGVIDVLMAYSTSVGCAQCGATNLPVVGHRCA